MKKTLAIIMLAVLVLGLTACNSPNPTHVVGNRAYYGQDVQTFNYAYIWLGNKMMVEGYITQWRDYDECDEIQLLIDGKYYLTQYSNVLMVSDPSMSGVGYDSGWVDHN